MIFSGGHKIVAGGHKIVAGGHKIVAGGHETRPYGCTGIVVIVRQLRFFRHFSLFQVSVNSIAPAFECCFSSD